MFISMLLTYSYCLGARRRWWMPFRAPFLTACERFAENTSSSRIKLITRLFYWFILNPAYAPSNNPFGIGSARPIGRIHRSHAVGGANGTTMVVMFVGGLCRWSTEFPYYSYSRKPTGREFFVPARTHSRIPVKPSMIFPNSLDSHMPAKLLFNSDTTALGCRLLCPLDTAVIHQLWHFPSTDQIIVMILTLVWCASGQMHHHANYLLASHSYLCFIAALCCLCNKSSRWLRHQAPHNVIAKGCHNHCIPTWV
jgi:hypothetical protein